MVFPNSLAKLYIEQAGQQYEPSNGTEGAVFHAEFCARCERDKDMNGTCHAEGREARDEDWCPILGASFCGEAKEWVYGADGHPTCTAFTPMGQKALERCEHTSDMFDQEGRPCS